jgi:hypothetical protein
MSTKTLFGTELKSKLLDGIQKLNASVSSTLGPGGRTVLIQKGDGTISTTKDGVSVAKSFHSLDDDIENIGVFSSCETLPINSFRYFSSCFNCSISLLLFLAHSTTSLLTSFIISFVTSILKFFSFLPFLKLWIVL